MKTYAGIGIMSGTSLDGLDLAHCTFTELNGQWDYQINKAVTIPYPDDWKRRLAELHDAEDSIIQKTNHELGEYIGHTVYAFIRENRLNLDFIASHGHTVFHEPEKKITLQIGDGEKIAKINGLPVICDFRSSDVAMGGQGAPLVPLGDRLLFRQYDYCLNLGGIANISFESKGQRLAFDICPVNMVLNSLAAREGKLYDDKGFMASGGKIIIPLLAKLEALSFYKISGPRSLGREWVLSHVFPLVDAYPDHSTEDLLATFTEHIALRISAAVQSDKNQRMLISGGGAYNDFLIKRIPSHTDLSIVLPDVLVIEFKEAMIFAFLGLLRLRKEVNVLGSVTGSGQDHSAGMVIRPGEIKLNNE